MNYSCLYLSRYGRINFVVKLRFVTERGKAHCNGVAVLLHKHSSLQWRFVVAAHVKLTAMALRCCGTCKAHCNGVSVLRHMHSSLQWRFVVAAHLTLSVTKFHEIHGLNLDLVTWSSKLHSGHAHNQDLPRRTCLLYTSPSPRDATLSRMPSSA